MKLTDILLIIVNFTGALAVFLFAMKLMSEGLQKAAGSKMRTVLGKMTGNRLNVILTGMVPDVFATYLSTMNPEPSLFTRLTTLKAVESYDTVSFGCIRMTAVAAPAIATTATAMIAITFVFMII